MFDISISASINPQEFQWFREVFRIHETFR